MKLRLPVPWAPHVPAPSSDPLAQAHELRKRAAELRAEAARLDRQAAFLTLDAHKARKGAK